MSLNDLKLYVGGSNADDTVLNDCYLVATELVNKFCGSSVVPSIVKDRAIVLVGAEMFWQKKAPNGISPYQGFDGAAVRVARDPMVSAYPILKTWVVTGI